MKINLSTFSEWTGIAAPAVSPAGKGRIYFDSTSSTFKLSRNAGAYADLATTDQLTCYTTTTANFTQPAVNGNVQASFGVSLWMVAGQIIYVATGGYYQVVSVDSGTLATIKNLGYTGNLAPGQTVPNGSGVSAGGLIGPGGGGGITPSVGVYASRPAQGTAGALFYPTDGYSGWIDDGTLWRPVFEGVAGVAPLAAAGFTGHNTNANSSISDSNGALLISDTNQSSALPNYRTWTRSIPGSETAVEALVWACPNLTGFNGTAQNYAFQGICLRESATNKIAAFMTVSHPSGYSIISCEYATSETTGRTVISGHTDKRLGNNIVGSPHLYLRLLLSGGNVLYQYSVGRTGWQTIATIATTTVFTTAPDQYGVMVWGYNANNPTSVRAIVPHLTVY